MTACSIDSCSVSWAKLAQGSGRERDPSFRARRMSLVRRRSSRQTLRCSASDESRDDGICRVIGRPTSLFMDPQIQPWRRFLEFINQLRESSTIRRAFVTLVGQTPAFERCRGINLHHNTGAATVNRLALPGKLGEEGRTAHGGVADVIGGDTQGSAGQLPSHLVSDAEDKLSAPVNACDTAGHLDVPSTVSRDEIDELVRPTERTVDTGLVRDLDRLDDQIIIRLNPEIADPGTVGRPIKPCHRCPVCFRREVDSYRQHPPTIRAWSIANASPLLK